MSLTAFTTEKDFARHQLAQPGLNYEEAYVNLGRLLFIGGKAPALMDAPVITTVQRVLQRKAYIHKKQCFFLYKKAAEILTRIMVRTHDDERRLQALHVLRDVICNEQGPLQKGAAEALGVLPLDIQGPSIDAAFQNGFTPMPWEALRRMAGVTNGTPLKRMGRSFIARTSDPERICVIKCARASENIAALETEVFWMRYIAAHKKRLNAVLHFPTPTPVHSNAVLGIQNPPPEIQSAQGLHPKRLAICFWADRRYFEYPNEAYGARMLTREQLTDVLARNAFLLGRLTSRGIVHLAPIPLFHNRIQANRRNDDGIYQWLRAGRLDRWLESCRYPNIGVSGVRDFEHFSAFHESPRQLYLHIGSHILGLVLVAGSSFRYRDQTRVGLDENGAPTDARDLFVPGFFKALIESIFLSYYEGFVGCTHQGPAPRDLDALTRALIDQMGVDRCMDEILRVHDQERMSDEAFYRFLEERGADNEMIQNASRAEKDIPLATGPHLGEFNGQIAPPELIEFVSSAASLCVAGGFLKKRGVAIDPIAN